MTNPVKTVDQVYDSWNAAIAKTFFSNQSSGKLVYLDLDEDMWPTISEQVDSRGENTKDKFLDAVKRTIKFEKDGWVFNYHLEKVEDWKENRTGPPPCIALLALFVVVAEGMISDEKYSSTNYYGRLAETLDVRDKNNKTRLQKSFSRQSLKLWDTLNEWLESNDGRFGVPTAFSFDHRKYVGVPISQALVRAGDRKHLPNCFRLFGLRSGQQISPPDMERMLDDWLPQSNISAGLKGAWKKSKDARGRITEVVCIELDSWDDIDIFDGAEQGSVRPLFLACSYQKFPHISFQFRFVSPNRHGSRLGKYSVSTSRDTDGNELFGDSEITLVDSGIHGFSLLESKGAIHLSGTLLANIVAKHRQDDISVSRYWKSIIVLVFREEAKLWIESRRVELAERHILLVHRSQVMDVCDYLDSVCSDKYRRLDHDNLESIPSEFVAFFDVRITGIRKIGQEDLQCLIPVASTNVVFEGGYSITGRDTWHRNRPPTVHIATLSSNPCVAYINSNQDENHHDSFKFTRAKSIDLSRLNLADGNYQIVVESENIDKRIEKLTTRSFHLRSAESPRIFNDNVIVRSPEFESTSWVLSAAECGDTVPSTFINGALIKPWEPLRKLDNDIYSIPREISGGKLEETEQVQQFETRRTLETHEPTCLERGCHLWVLPPGSGFQNRRTKQLGKCRDCGAEKWHGYGTVTKKKNKGNAKVLVHHESVVPVLIDSVHSGQLDAPDAETVYDALVHRGRGTSHHIKQLVQPLGNESYRATHYVTVMSALGHMEISVDIHSGRLLEWQIPPPTINYVGDQCIYLSGLRTQRLVEEISSLVEQFGGSTTKTVQLVAPPRIGIVDLSLEQVEKIAELIPEEITKTVYVSSMPSCVLAERLPSLESLLGSLPERRWPDAQVEKFSFVDFRWNRIEYPDGHGAFRFSLIQNMYMVVTEESFRTRTGYVADYQLIKHLAGLICKHPLLGYNPDTESLFVPLGCELPAIYERCVALHSGHEPKRLESGIVEYRGVSPKVAHAIWGSVTNT